MTCRPQRVPDGSGSQAGGSAGRGPPSTGSRHRRPEGRSDRPGPRARPPRSTRPGRRRPGRNGAGGRRPTDSSRRRSPGDLRRPPAVTITRAPTASRLEAVPSRRSVRQWPPVGPVVEVGQGLVLRDDHQVDPAVVVEVARGQPAADPRDAPGRPGAVADVDRTGPPSAAGQELRRHRVRDRPGGSR